MNGIIRYVVFCNWLLSLRIMVLRFTHVVSMYQYFISFYCQIVFHHMNVPHFICILYAVYALPIHSTVGHLYCFWILVIIHNAILNVHFCVDLFSFLLVIYLGVELLSHMVTPSVSYRSCQTVFHSSCTILYSHKQCMRVSISPHPCQRLLLSVFFIITILICVKWYVAVIFFFKEIAFLFFYLFYLFIFGCVGSSFLCEGFL